MDAAEIRRLKPKLRKYLQWYGDCFGRSDTRGHLDTYVTGQLSKLDRKSVEPIALAAGVPPRTLQQFLNSLEWDQEQLIDTLQWRVARAHTSQPLDRHRRRNADTRSKRGKTAWGST
jgi:SRSO17 transposase